MKTSDAARALAAKRKTFAGGRAPVLKPCPKCGKILSARDRAKACPEHGDSK